MLGSLGNLTGLLKTARELQGNMARMQEQLASLRYEAESGGGLVRVTVDGRGAMLDIKIQPSAVGDVELLEDLVKSAAMAASAKAQEGMAAEMSKATGGLNLPPNLLEMLGGAPRP